MFEDLVQECSQYIKSLEKEFDTKSKRYLQEYDNSPTNSEQSDKNLYYHDLYSGIKYNLQIINPYIIMFQAMPEENQKKEREKLAILLEPEISELNSKVKKYEEEVDYLVKERNKLREELKKCSVEEKENIKSKIDDIVGKAVVRSLTAEDYRQKLRIKKSSHKYIKNEISGLALAKYSYYSKSNNEDDKSYYDFEDIEEIDDLDKQIAAVGFDYEKSKELASILDSYYEGEDPEEKDTEYLKKIKKVVGPEVDIKEMPVTYGISGLNYIKYSTEKVYIDKILKMLIQRTKQFFAEKDLEKTEEKSQINNETKILIRK